MVLWLCLFWVDRKSFLHFSHIHHSVEILFWKRNDKFNKHRLRVYWCLISISRRHGVSTFLIFARRMGEVVLTSFLLSLDRHFRFRCQSAEHKIKIRWSRSVVIGNKLGGGSGKFSTPDKKGSTRPTTTVLWGTSLYTVSLGVGTWTTSEDDGTYDSRLGALSSRKWEGPIDGTLPTSTVPISGTEIPRIPIPPKQVDVTGSWSGRRVKTEGKGKREGVHDWKLFIGCVVWRSRRRRPLELHFGLLALFSGWEDHEGRARNESYNKVIWEKLET